MILSVRNLNKSFGRLRILNNLSFDVQKGELKAIIGPNGAGKTTLFNVITGRFTPDDGTVMFQNRDVTGAKPHVLSRLGMARAFQISNFFVQLSVRNNIELAVQSRLNRRTSIWRDLGGHGTLKRSTDEVLEWIGLEE